MMERHRNPNGTYNGVTLMAELTGLDKREVAWTAARLKQLIVVEKRPKDEAKAIVTDEAKRRPWLDQNSESCPD